MGSLSRASIAPWCRRYFGVGRQGAATSVLVAADEVVEWRAADGSFWHFEDMTAICREAASGGPTWLAGTVAGLGAGALFGRALLEVGR
jgi:hypothetical protein